MDFEEQRIFTADLILTDAIMDMALIEGIEKSEARQRLLTSKSYALLYDWESGLWQEGPDYFRSFYAEVN